MGKPVVHLRAYRSKNGSKELSYNANGQVQNENFLIKEIHNTLEWKNYLRHIGVHGFVKVVVEKVMDGETSLPVDEIQKEVNDALNPIANVPQTPEQKRIADLEAKIEALTNPKATVKAVVGNDNPTLPEGKVLEDLKRGELEELFPNVSALEPKNKGEFIAHVLAKYPNLK